MEAVCLLVAGPGASALHEPTTPTPREPTEWLWGPPHSGQGIVLSQQSLFLYWPHKWRGRPHWLLLEWLSDQDSFTLRLWGREVWFLGAWGSLLKPSDSIGVPGWGQRRQLAPPRSCTPSSFTNQRDRRGPGALGSDGAQDTLRPKIFVFPGRKFTPLKQHPWFPVMASRLRGQNSTQTWLCPQGPGVWTTQRPSSPHEFIDRPSSTRHVASTVSFCWFHPKRGICFSLLHRRILGEPCFPLGVIWHLLCQIRLSYFLAGWERWKKRFCLIKDRHCFPEMMGEMHQPSLRPARPAWPLSWHLRGPPPQPRSRGPWALVNPAESDYSNVIMWICLWYVFSL